MAKYDYLIIGGGIAGVTAAETIRENDKDASIAIFSGEPHPLYSRVLLPSYLKRRISREQVFLRTVDDFTKKRIDLRLEQKVTGIDVNRKEIVLGSATAGYDKLLIASGGKVTAWGTEEEQRFLYRLQTIDDADRIAQALGTLTRPVVVGASFISLELLEIFTASGITPQLLARDTHFFQQFLDPAGGEILYNNFYSHGIAVQFNDEISEILVRGDSLLLNTKGLRRIECDSIAVGIGVERSIGFLKGSGIPIGERGVITNEFLETGKEGVYAAGDIAEFYDTLQEKHHVEGNWTNAFLHGKRAGLNMVGKREVFQAVSSYSITNFGYHITVLGDTMGIEDTIIRSDPARARYERLFLKDGRIVGAALINQFQDKSHVTKLIVSRVSVEQYRNALRDVAFDIRTVGI